MEQTTLIKKLSALGLDAKEAETYITLLRLGPSPVSAITTETGLNRSSLYVVLDRLQKQGLVSKLGNRGVKKYTAMGPEKLTSISKERLERAVLARQGIETLLPELEKHRRLVRHKPRMWIYSGKEGLRSSFEYSLGVQEKTIRIVSSAGKIVQSLPDYLPIYMRERYRRGIKMIGIHPDDAFARELLRHTPESSVDEQALVPEPLYTFPSDFGIFDDKIAFMSHQPPLSVYVECKAMADNMKTLFDLAFKQARRVGRHINRDHG